MAQKTSTVNMPFREDLLKQIDTVARTESRTRSELVREAARMSIERERRMDAVIESIRETARRRGITVDTTSYPADPDDDAPVDCAIGSRSVHIVSGDSHLTDMGTVEGMEVLTPGQFAHLFER